MKPTFLAAVLLFAVSAASAKTYQSPDESFKTTVPSGWIETHDEDGSTYSEVNFRDPSYPQYNLSLRWYGRYKPHITPDRMIEMYSGVDDFIKQLKAELYGGSPSFVEPCATSRSPG